MSKYYIILLLFIFCVSPLFAQFNGEVNISKDVKSSNCKAEILLAYDFDLHKAILTPYTKYTNYFINNNLFSNNPYRDVFESGVIIGFKNIYLQYQHICSHAVSSLNINNSPVLDYYQEPNSSVNYITIGYKWGE